MCLYEGSVSTPGCIYTNCFPSKFFCHGSDWRMRHKRIKVASICIISSRALHSTCWFRSSLEAPGCIMIYLDACSLESVSIWWMFAIVLAAIQFERVLIAPVCQPFTCARTFLDIENLHLVTAWSQSHDSKVCFIQVLWWVWATHWIRELTLIGRSNLAAMGMCQARGRNIYIYNIYIYLYTYTKIYIYTHIHLHIYIYVPPYVHPFHNNLPWSKCGGLVTHDFLMFHKMSIYAGLRSIDVRGFNFDSPPELPNRRQKSQGTPVTPNAFQGRGVTFGQWREVETLFADFWK